MNLPALWQRPPRGLLLLLPLSLLFAALSALRRLAYRLGWLQQYRLAVPVVIVGNITVGGAGKTPTVHHLAQALRAHGLQPGVISRGYGGKVAGVAAVDTGGDPGYFGDEPLLLARLCHCPVFVGRDRVAAGQALLQAHPEVDVIISDDGLQHYRLARDVEIVVMDGARGLGNGWRLPIGPLREKPARLQEAAALVRNGAGDAQWPAHAHTFQMQLQPGLAYRLGDSTQQRALASFAGEPLAALAGIGNPARFFATLRSAGLQCSEQAFPDHHRFTSADLAACAGQTLLVTEKDAVKLEHIKATLPDDVNIWVLPVSAVMEPDLAAWLLARLRTLPRFDTKARLHHDSSQQP